MNNVTPIKWSAQEAAKHQASAKRIFNAGHAYEHRGIDVDNCGFCALTIGNEEGPNYAGWARLYIEAQRPMPSEWKAAFEREMNSDNPAYRAALHRSVATFGGPKWLG